MPTSNPVNHSSVSSHHHDDRICSLQHMTMLSPRPRLLREHLCPLMLAYDRQGDGPDFFAASLLRVQPIPNEMSFLCRSTRNCDVTTATFHTMLHVLAMKWTSGFDCGSPVRIRSCGRSLQTRFTLSRKYCRYDR